MSQNPSKILTQERLKELLHYDPETGVFTWLVRRGFKAKAGSVAGTPHNAGYVLVRVDSKHYLAHRIVFLYMTGTFPSEQVDHINGNRADNRWCNLRDVTHADNNYNIGGPFVTNTSGYLGAYFNKRQNSWFAQISLNNKSRFLGYHPTPEAAHAAYLKAKDELHSTHMRLRQVA